MIREFNSIYVVNSYGAVCRFDDTSDKTQTKWYGTTEAQHPLEVLKFADQVKGGSTAEEIKDI